MDIEQKKQRAQAIINVLETFNKDVKDYVENIDILLQYSDKEGATDSNSFIKTETYPYLKVLLSEGQRSQNIYMALIAENKILIEEFQKSINTGDIEDISIQYLQLIHSELNSQKLQNLRRLFLQINTRLKSAQPIARDDGRSIENTIRTIHASSAEFLQLVVQFQMFKYFEKIEHSIVIVGANGSGKSSFSRNTRKILGENITIISAQKSFQCEKLTAIPLGDTSLQEVHNYQSNDKLGKTWGIDRSHATEIKSLLGALISEHSKKANSYYQESKNSNPLREASILEQTMEVWGEIITHRCMRYNASNIIIHTQDSTYEFPQLSDGEKAVFYYVAHILLAKKNSYIIIDEPETHLHVAIVSQLWDKLEILRQDCRFIYLTHNLDFASSRIAAVKFWSKSFSPPATWDIELLPTNSDLPEALLMEVLGSRKKILFCEGEKSSLDFKLYSILFHEYAIKPVGGHLSVINFTKSLNKAKNIFGNSAIGLIDGDFHGEKSIAEWEKESIYTIKIQEVENVLCDILLLKAAKERFCGEENSIEKAKVCLFKKFTNNKSEQAIEYATQVINNTFKSNMLKRAQDIKILKENFDTTVQSIDIEKLVKNREELIQRIIDSNDYDKGIRYFNSKGLIGEIPISIEKDYKTKVFLLLESDSELQIALKEKYFSFIPSTTKDAPK